MDLKVQTEKNSNSEFSRAPEEKNHETDYLNTTELEQQFLLRIFDTSITREERSVTKSSTKPDLFENTKTADKKQLQSVMTKSSTKCL